MTRSRSTGWTRTRSGLTTSRRARAACRPGLAPCDARPALWALAPRASPPSGKSRPDPPLLLVGTAASHILTTPSPPPLAPPGGAPRWPHGPAHATTRAAARPRGAARRARCGIHPPAWRPTADGRGDTGDGGRRGGGIRAGGARLRPPHHSRLRARCLRLGSGLLIGADPHQSGAPRAPHVHRLHVDSRDIACCARKAKNSTHSLREQGGLDEGIGRSIRRHTPRD